MHCHLLILFFNVISSILSTFIYFIHFHSFYPLSSILSTFIHFSSPFPEFWPSLPIHLFPDELGRGGRLLPNDVRPPRHWRFRRRAASGEVFLQRLFSAYSGKFIRFCKRMLSSFFLNPSSLQRVKSLVQFGSAFTNPALRHSSHGRKHNTTKIFCNIIFWIIQNHPNYYGICTQEWLWLVRGVSISRGRLGWIRGRVWGKFFYPF